MRRKCCKLLSPNSKHAKGAAGADMRGASKRNMQQGCCQRAVGSDFIGCVTGCRLAGLRADGLQGLSVHVQGHDAVFERLHTRRQSRQEHEACIKIAFKGPEWTYVHKHIEDKIPSGQAIGVTIDGASPQS